MTDSTKVRATNYKVEYNGTDWTITRLSDNTSFTAKPDASGNLSFDGLNVKISGSANNKDSFIVKPVNDVIVNMDVAISDESKLAMASAQEAAKATIPMARSCWIYRALSWWGTKPLTMLMPRWSVRWAAPRRR